MEDDLEMDDELDIYLIIENKNGKVRTHMEEMKMWDDLNVVLNRYDFSIRGLTHFKGICNYVHGIERIIKEAKELEAAENEAKLISQYGR